MEEHKIVSAVMRLFYRGGAISQDVYHQDLFRLFKKGYPEVSAEDLEDAFFGDWNERGEEPDDAQKRKLERLTLAWSEWTYAWENYDPAAAARTS